MSDAGSDSAKTVTDAQGHFAFKVSENGEYTLALVTSSLPLASRPRSRSGRCRPSSAPCEPPSSRCPARSRARRRPRATSPRPSPGSPGSAARRVCSSGSCSPSRPSGCR
ncbi:hypothetical protein [Amnibacterium kyonggiense]